MAGKSTAPFGSWPSPVSTKLIVADAIHLSELCVDGDDLYWTELRPTEEGRQTVVRRPRAGRPVEVTPAPWNVRTRVHEYGGGSFTARKGLLAVSNFPDNLVYAGRTGDTLLPLTRTSEHRYADLMIDPFRDRLVCVGEDHSGGSREAVNRLVSLDLGGSKTEVVLAEGHDFYSSPALSPDGGKLAWLSWNHPNMPWTESELWLAELADNGSVRDPRRVAGGDGESLFQPQWSPSGDLYFVSDRTGWWNIVRLRDEQTDMVTNLPAEFGVPQWIFGLSTYAFLDAESIACVMRRDGVDHLGILKIGTGKVRRLDVPFTEMSQLRTSHGRVFLIAGGPSRPTALVAIDPTSLRVEEIQVEIRIPFGPESISVPRTITFSTGTGQRAHGYYYQPRNGGFEGPAGNAPPLLVSSHGGPTSHADTSLDLRIQYWTSRGIAYLDVDYGGSSGYGRAYRDRLDGKWGVVDVDDCVNGALYLVREGLADPVRLAIEGSSAGGYTTLCALTFRNVFKAGISRYGVGDLEPLARDTHKFESRYLDRLIGPYPEARSVYQQRSPINFTDQISCPVALFQGLEDRVMPPNQAEMIVHALRVKKLPFAYVTFENEGHGFKRADSIERTMSGSLYFLSRVFEFEPAGQVPPLVVENLA